MEDLLLLVLRERELVFLVRQYMCPNIDVDVFVPGTVASLQTRRFVFSPEHTRWLYHYGPCVSTQFFLLQLIFIRKWTR